MNKVQSAQEFSESILSDVPSGFNLEQGYFNVFDRSDYDGPMEIAFGRKDFYSISLINGPTRVYYDDQSIEFEKSALLFTNPNIPYSWKLLGDKPSGYCCIFTEPFFNPYQRIQDYPLFKPGVVPIINLTDKQVNEINILYQKMLDELGSGFVYKYDVLRNLILSLVFHILKLRPDSMMSSLGLNGLLRLSARFISLLDAQFPVESPMQKLKFRHPTDFANELNVHVNYLNRALQETKGMRTSQVISERLLSEARKLLKHSDWNISEIADCLGFAGLAHFTNFFKKNELITPKEFRSLNEVH